MLAHRLQTHGSTDSLRRQAQTCPTLNVVQNTASGVGYHRAKVWLLYIKTRYDPRSGPALEGGGGEGGGGGPHLVSNSWLRKICSRLASSSVLIGHLRAVAHHCGTIRTLIRPTCGLDAVLPLTWVPFSLPGAGLLLAELVVAPVALSPIGCRIMRVHDA